MLDKSTQNILQGIEQCTILQYYFFITSFEGNPLPLLRHSRFSDIDPALNAGLENVNQHI